MAAKKPRRLLDRRSGDENNPRILGAFNEATPDWLAFFMFTYFTDRDGKFQLCRPVRVLRLTHWPVPPNSC